MSRHATFIGRAKEMPYKNKEARQAYHREYYRRLKSGEVTARGTRSPRNLLGIKFGHLTAIRFSHREGILQIPIWEFLCDCGNTRLLSARDVVPGKTTACGCMSQGRTKRYHNDDRAFRAMYNSYKNAAKYRNFCFELTQEEFHSLTQRNCTYCGMEPTHEHRVSRHRSKYFSNGVDRVDNSLGYTKGNSAPCCKICNHAKHTMSATEFTAWLDRVAKFRTQQNPESPAIVQGNEQTPCSI